MARCRVFIYYFVLYESYFQSLHLSLNSANLLFLFHQIFFHLHLKYIHLVFLLAICFCLYFQSPQVLFSLHVCPIIFFSCCLLGKFLNVIFQFTNLFYKQVFLVHLSYFSHFILLFFLSSCYYLKLLISSIFWEYPLYLFRLSVPQFFIMELFSFCLLSLLYSFHLAAVCEVILP